MKIEVSSPLLSMAALNSWAHLPYEQHMGFDCKSAIYSYKRRIITSALHSGECTIRLVQVERPCKTCKGTGTYEWIDWNDEDNREYEDCRRCRATGKVTLRFVESNINGFRWHTPVDKGSFIVPTEDEWKSAAQTDWVPEQPGKPLSRIELIYHLNAVERVIAGGKLFRWNDGWRGSVTNYSLHLGEHETCFVCGQKALSRYSWTYGHEVFRPGLKWRQHVCDDCVQRADRWPRQWPANFYPNHDRGRWITERWEMRVPLPDLAHDSSVVEWLARRGIVEGRLPPTEYGYWDGMFVQVTAHINGSTAIRGTSLDCWFNDVPAIVPAKQVKARATRLLSGGQE